ncbi:MAG: Glutamate synthase (NADPH) small chain [candidate division BRC1 bacterium ADurb.BinA364]|nr:MAG: Glutamate synthase (NADPH) small chain [candidate division BRC1 bacterium ADurb.BinA364]
MATKKVVKKKSFGSRGGFGGGSSRGREQSPLRPKHVPKLAPCGAHCPSGNKVRSFVTAIAQAELLGKTPEQAYEDAWHIYTETSPFPAVCGRVCPHPCEDNCNRKELDGAVGINKIERAIGDFGIEKKLKIKVLDEEKKPQKVAIVGAGPAGISCACQLARRGYGVTIFEAMEKPGGMLLWGIPGYRLPEGVLEKEIQKVLDLGVELKCGVKVGKDLSIDDLRQRFDAVFVAIGAQQGMLLGVEGEDARNVFTGVDFLNRFHHGEQLDLGDKVAVVVVGGGDTAIDAARICKRLGCDVTILYRRTIAEMPAIALEIKEALEEGIKIEFLAAPIGFDRDGDRVTAMKCIRMELGEPDSSGRRRPVPIEGSDFKIEVSAVISAISQEPDFTGFEALREGRDWVKVDEYGATKVDGVWAGGDVVNLDLVTTAIGHGRRAAESIIAKFTGQPIVKDDLPPIPASRIRMDHYERQERIEANSLGVEERLGLVDAEVHKTLRGEAVLIESKRCFSCGQCFYCEKCWLFCQDSAIEKAPAKGELYKFKLENCTGCKKCSEECPCGFIEMF